MLTSETFTGNIVHIFNERKSNRRKVDSESEQSGSPMNGTVSEAHPGEVFLKSVGKNVNHVTEQKRSFIFEWQSVWYRDDQSSLKFRDGFF